MLNDTPNEIANATTSADEPGSGDNNAPAEAPMKDNVSNDLETVVADTAAKDQDERRERFRALQVRAVSRLFANNTPCMVASTLASGARTTFRKY